MSEREKNEIWQDDAIRLDKEIERDGLITESHEPSSKEAYHHSSHHGGEHYHRSHHSSGRHRHHSRRRSRSKQKKNKWKQDVKHFWRKNKKYLTYTFLAVVFFICAVFVGIYFDRIIGQQDNQGETNAFQNTDGKLLVSVPTFDGDVSLVSSAVQAYLDKEEGVTAHDIFDRYKGTSYRLDVGSPVTLSYEIKSAPAGYSVQSAEFSLSEDPTFEKPIVQVVDAKEKEAVFYNLKTGMLYYYRIDILFENGEKHFVGGQFRTAEGPRLMKVDGVYNMRDVGGWTTLDGRVIRQGLLYRGCEIDGAVVSKYAITKEGINTMLAELGIKTDMDLRPYSENPYNIDVLGGNVEHIHYGAPMYNAIFEAGVNQETMKKIFSDLAKPNQYPVYLHCTYGQDRTGTVCYLLGALLGVSQDDLLQDYELTALCHGYVADADIVAFMQRVNQLPGTTLSEKVEHYLLSIGVTQKEIATIRQIFLD